LLTIKKYLNRRTSGPEALVVLAVIAGIGFGGYFLYKAISARILEAKLNAALPEVCSEIRTQRAKIISAIEAYRKEFGLYPPDHVVNRQPLQVNAYTNPLLYELVGAVTNSDGMLRIPGLEPAELAFAKEFFHSTGFVNSGSSTGDVRHFISLGSTPTRKLHDDPDVFALGVQLVSGNVPVEVFWEFDFGPWQYVSSSPMHNPGKFDLWIEVKTRKQNVTIGNWKQVE